MSDKDTQQQAVALAEKYGVYTSRTYDKIEIDVARVTAMLADHRQHIIEELAQGSGVLPVVMCVAGDLQDDVPVITEARVREAIASLQAKHEARVLELEKALLIARKRVVDARPAMTFSKSKTVRAYWPDLDVIDAAINKEGGV